MTDYKWGCAYANEFPVAVEDLDVGKLRTIRQEAVDLLRNHYLSCLRLGPVFACCTLAFALQLMDKERKEPQSG